MTRRLPGRFCAGILLLGLAVLAWPARSEAAANSIQELMAAKEKWPELLNVEMRVEGRYVSIGKNVVRFEKCPLTFRAMRNFPKRFTKSRTVEVTGHLAKQGARTIFVVSRLRERPSDDVRFRGMILKAERDDVEEWTEACEWARQRAKFYEDEELLELARENYERIVLVQRQKFARQPEKLLALSERAWKFGLDDAFVADLKHEAYVLKWQDLRTQDDPAKELDTLRDAIARDLPGAKSSLEGTFKAEKERYLEGPIEYYFKADEKTRARLHRMLYNTVSLKRILLDAEDDGANGEEIGRRIARDVPELSELADAYRERQRAYDLSNVANKTRSEAVGLSNRFEEAGDDERAEKALRRWLEARVKKYRADGPPGLIVLADEYLTLLDDEEQAAGFLLEAWEADPESKDVETRLNRLGYVLAGKEWVPESEVAATPQGERARAIRDGRVIVGMTSREVIQSRGKPRTVTRVVTSGGITEIWIYGGQDEAALAVRLSGRTRKRDARVAHVSIVGPR